jgi:hypothetical protein
MRKGLSLIFVQRSRTQVDGRTGCGMRCAVYTPEFLRSSSVVHSEAFGAAADAVNQKLFMMIE